MPRFTTAISASSIRTLPPTSPPTPGLRYSEDPPRRPTPSVQRPTPIPPTPDPRPTTHGYSAFTLVEVTISVAIAVVLMLGISQVFKVVGDTVGTGEALATAQRDARATQAVFAHDFNTAVTDTAPFMLLNSQQTFAFRNAADLAADKDGNPATYDPYNTGTESLYSAATYNYRNHRVDCLTYFGRGSFLRQTGADVSSSGASPFVSSMGGMEAMLWYGHLNLADNAGSFTTTSGSNNSPGVGTSTVGASTYYNTVNPNNYFATSWILGRQQIILQPPVSLYNNNTTLSPAAVIDQSSPGAIQYAYMPTSAVPLSPLAATSVAYASSGTSSMLAGATIGSFTLLSSRIDLAATSLLGFQNTLASYVPTNSNWWQKLPTGIGGLRFQAQPFFLTKPPTPESMAYQAPIFVRGCTQFTVEYAGDYLNQNSTAPTVANQGITDTYVHADGTAGTTDGQIDFIVAAAPTVTGANTTQNTVRKIRWYGFPRSTTNNATISAANGDVVPLQDIFAIATSGASLTNIPAHAPFEVAPWTTAADYSKLTSLPPYICAWGPQTSSTAVLDPKPKMIRITLTIDDPGGRLGDGQTYEYIYTLP